MDSDTSVFRAAKRAGFGEFAIVIGFEEDNAIISVSGDIGRMPKLIPMDVTVRDRTTNRTQTFHADAFRAVGADPADYRVVVVKSAQHFYNGFVGLAKEILYVASPGAADPDVTRLPYTKRKTPFWPKVADPWK